MWIMMTGDKRIRLIKVSCDEVDKNVKYLQGVSDKVIEKLYEQVENNHMDKTYTLILSQLIRRFLYVIDKHGIVKGGKTLDKALLAELEAHVVVSQSVTSV